jgi:hypothetical protein
MSLELLPEIAGTLLANCWNLLVTGQALLEPCWKVVEILLEPC